MSGISEGGGEHGSVGALTTTTAAATCGSALSGLPARHYDLAMS